MTSKLSERHWAGAVGKMSDEVSRERILEAVEESGDKFLVAPSNSLWGPPVLKMVEEGSLAIIRSIKSGRDAGCIMVERKKEFKPVFDCTDQGECW